MAALSMGIRAQEKGVEPDWDIRPVLKEIAAHAQRMVPVLLEDGHVVQIGWQGRGCVVGAAARVGHA